MTTEYTAVDKDVLQMVHDVIEEFPIFDEHRGMHILVLFRTGDIPKSKGREVWGKAEKVPAKWNAAIEAVGGVAYDVMIWFTWRVWLERLTTERERKALIFHELCHFRPEFNDAKDEYDVKIVGHDAEFFTAELNAFGPWRPSLQEVQKIMRQEELPGMRREGSVATLRVPAGDDGPEREIDLDAIPSALN